MRPYARLWRELLVKASNPDTIFSIFERFSLPDSNLRDVSIMFTPLDSASDIPIIPSSALYKLHELTISSCGLSWRPGDGTPNELRRLTLRDTALLTVDMLLQMLSMTTQLAELVIRHSRLGPSARNVQAGSVVLPNLQEFRLDHVTTEGATQLFLAIQYFEPTVKVVEFITAYEKDLAPPVVQRFTQHFHYAVSQVPNPSLSLRIGKGSLSFACGGFSLCFGESGGEWSRFGAVGKWETFEDLMERHFGPVFKTSTGPGLIIDGPPHGTTVEARSRLMMTCAMSLPHARSLHLVATDGELEAWLLGLAADYPVLERTRAAEVKKTFRAFPNLTALRLDERPGGHKKSVRGGIPMLNHFEETLAGLVRQRRSEPDVQEIKRLIIVEEMVIEDDYNTLPRLLSSLGFS
ncbi:hypothetical protein FRB90_001177 [Tulasnella sp. 427]|nr:hypothetical protein FRB90_001177 [Tulasnella sp. 427]